MPEYLSKVTYAVVGGSDEYNIPFSFLTSAHVKVKQGSGENIMATSDYSVSGDTLTITGSYDVPVTIYRETPGSTSATKKTPDNQYVDFKNGSVITESDLDNSTLQAIYVSQEAMDKALDAEATPGSSGNVPTPGLSQDEYILTADGTAGASVWSSPATVQGILNVSEAQAGTTIPIRDSSGSVIGNITGDVTGNADTSTVLATSRDFTTSGDVTCAAPVGFTGAAGVTLATTVAKINGVTATAAVADDDGKVLTYNHGSTSWEPTTTANPTKAVIVVKKTGNDDGQTIVGGGWRHVYLPNADDTLMNEGTGITVTNGAESGYVTLSAGTWQVTWNQIFGLDMNRSMTRLRQASDVGFSADLDTSGVGTMIRAGAAGNSTSSSAGFARLVLAATRHIRLEAYAESSGDLGENDDATQAEGYIFTLIAITKEF